MSKRILKILLVEDDRQIRQVIRDLLRGEGRHLIVMEDGDKAFQKLEDEAFDLLVTDLGLPGKTGWDLINKGRKHSPDLKVIVITSWTDCHSDEIAQNYKVDHMIRKPFRISQVTEAVEDLLTPKVSAEQK